MGRTGGRVTRERAGGPVVTEVMDAHPQLVKRVADLERQLARRAPVVAERRRALLEQQLAEVGERLAASEQARRRAEAELADLRERHAALEVAHRAATAGSSRAERLAAEPRVTVRWLKDSPPGGARIGDVTYVGRGPEYRQAHGPGGRPVEQLARLAEETVMPVSHADALCASGFVEPADDQADQFVTYFRLLHGGLARPFDPNAAAAAAAIDDGLRRTPVPDGWPEELSYARLHPDPLPPVYGRTLVEAPAP
jgi:hypothetical protein